MAQIVAVALASHAPLVTGKPDRAGARVDHRLRRRMGAPVTVPRTSYALDKVLTAIARQHALRARLTETDQAGHDLSGLRPNFAI